MSLEHQTAGGVGVNIQIPHPHLFGERNVGSVRQDEGHLLEFVGDGADGWVQLGATCFPFMKPETPKGFTATYTEEKGVRLRWNSVKQAQYYIVYRDTTEDFKIQAGYPFTGNSIATTASSGFTDMAVDTGRVYYYRASAVAGFGELMQGTGSESKPTEAVRVEIRGQNK